MQAMIELPESILHQLEALARQEGATAGELIRRIVEEHLSHSRPTGRRDLNVSLPLIPGTETGPLMTVTGQELDNLLADDHITA